MVEQTHHVLLQEADRAYWRGDYLSAIRHALSASTAPRDQSEVRCDALLTLARASLALKLPEEALGFAVGAHLSACWARDSEREMTACSVVSQILNQHPGLGEHRVDEVQH